MNDKTETYQRRITAIRALADQKAEYVKLLSDEKYEVNNILSISLDVDGTVVDLPRVGLRGYSAAVYYQYSVNARAELAAIAKDQLKLIEDDYETEIAAFRSVRQDALLALQEAVEKLPDGLFNLLAGAIEGELIAAQEEEDDPERIKDLNDLAKAIDGSYASGE